MDSSSNKVSASSTCCVAIYYITLLYCNNPDIRLLYQVGVTSISLQHVSVDVCRVETYCYIFFGHHIYSRVWINRVRLPILLVVS